MSYNYIWDNIRDSSKESILDKWVIYSPGTYPPSVFHGSYEDAKTEAVRLNKKCGGTFQILKIESYYKPQLVKHEKYKGPFFSDFIEIS